MLNPIQTWSPFLGGYLLLFLMLTVVALRAWWPSLCPQCSPPGLFVSPPIVTLTEGLAQQFAAHAEVSWNDTVNGRGLYVAPARIEAERMVTVTATSTSDPRRSAVGVVHLPANTLQPSDYSVVVFYNPPSGDPSKPVRLKVE